MLDARRRKSSIVHRRFYEKKMEFIRLGVMSAFLDAGELAV
jgi:hypothetical protein